MSKLPISLQKKAKDYKNLSDAAKEKLLRELYVNREMSYPQIAEVVDSYAKKVSRDAKKLGIESRTLAEAQSLALKTGRRTHPTEGKGHSEESKLRISEKMASTWDQLTETEKEHRSQIGKDHWNSFSEEKKAEMRQAAGDAVRQASKDGSKLEKFIYETLTNAGIVVEFHKERMVVNQRLQVDLFLPELNTAIEVDGPSHFKPIWGQETLDRNRRADNQKAGLILAQGCCLIRLRQTQSLSQHYKREVAKNLLEEVLKIKKKFPARGHRLIIIGGEENDEE